MGKFEVITRDDVQDQCRLTARHGSIYAACKLRAGDDSGLQLQVCLGQQPSSQHEREAEERIRLPAEHRAETVIKRVIHSKLKNLGATFGAGSLNHVGMLQAPP